MGSGVRVPSPPPGIGETGPGGQRCDATASLDRVYKFSPETKFVTGGAL